jgi:nitroimidazol reductase NimA-like FMN-containing flavoprotein (pyridoxamine 5'-phosphate oxidase superfamily)
MVERVGPVAVTGDQPVSARTRVRRRAGRGRYEREVVDAILDAAYIGHLAFVEDGQPYAIPMLYARLGDQLVLHGSPLSRVLGTARESVPMCFTVTVLDGLVLARSAFHHSLNYRSVVVLGQARRVGDEGEKHAALRALVDHIVPGRSDDARGPSSGELAATDVLTMPLDEASAKLRTGPPVDAAEDYALPVWAGEIPLRLTAGVPVPDDRCDAPFPAYLGDAVRT